MNELVFELIISHDIFVASDISHYVIIVVLCQTDACFLWRQRVSLLNSSTIWILIEL